MKSGQQVLTGRQEIIPQRYHCAIAQTPGVIGLSRETSFEVVEGHPFRLSGAIGLGAADAPQGEVDILILRWVREAEQTMYFADCIESAPHAGGTQMGGLILEEGTDRVDAGRKAQIFRASHHSTNIRTSVR